MFSYKTKFRILLQQNLQATYELSRFAPTCGTLLSDLSSIFYTKISISQIPHAARKADLSLNFLCHLDVFVVVVILWPFQFCFMALFFIFHRYWACQLPWWEKPSINRFMWPWKGWNPQQWTIQGFKSLSHKDPFLQMTYFI